MHIPSYDEVEKQRILDFFFPIFFVAVGKHDVKQLAVFGIIDYMVQKQRSLDEYRVAKIFRSLL